MQTIRIASLEDLAPHVHEYLVPLITDAVQACLHSYWSDPFNDNWTFGTQLWKNTWNRIKSIAENGNNPIMTPIRGNEFCFSIGNATIHHHRVGGDSLLPRSAKKVKALADEARLPFFSQEKRVAFDNVVLGIAADVHDGLGEIFIGKLEKDIGTDRYFWSETVHLIKKSGIVLETPKYIYFEEEAEAIPVLVLNPNAVSSAQSDVEAEANPVLTLEPEAVESAQPDA
jgi:hypothetical protein